MMPKALKPVLSLVFTPFLALAAHAQSATGYSHPDGDTDTAATADHYVKPSSSVAIQAAPPAYQDSYPATAVTPQPRLLPRDAAAIPAPGGAAPAPMQYAPQPQPMPVQTAEVDPARRGANADDGEIVLNVPSRPNELHRGTLLHARLRETISTKSTAEGTVFTAELTSDAGHDGVVLLPAGSLIRGHVASIRGGKRISGGASMHLRPETVSLPDGTLYRLDAQITDVDSTQDLRVNDEGTVVLHSNAKAAAAVVGGVAATAAVTGAVLGGGVGAAVGAIAGAGVGTAVYLKRDIQETLPAGTPMIFALDQSLAVSPR